MNKRVITLIQGTQKWVHPFTHQGSKWWNIIKFKKSRRTTSWIAV